MDLTLAHIFLNMGNQVKHTKIKFASIQDFNKYLIILLPQKFINEITEPKEVQAQFNQRFLSYHQGGCSVVIDQFGF